MEDQGCVLETPGQPSRRENILSNYNTFKRLVSGRC